MSRRDVTITLRQMLDYCQKTADLSKGKKRSDLDKDLVFNLALTRLAVCRRDSSFASKTGTPRKKAGVMLQSLEL
jgi:hypothetical protein